MLDTPLGAYPVGEQILRAAEITRLQNRLDAGLGWHLTAAQETAALTPSYHGIPVADIAAGSHTEPKGIRSSARLSHWLGDFPQFDEAFQAGSLPGAAGPRGGNP